MLKNAHSCNTENLDTLFHLWSFGMTTFVASFFPLKQQTFETAVSKVIPPPGSCGAFDRITQSAFTSVSRMHFDAHFQAGKSAHIQLTDEKLISDINRINLCTLRPDLH